MNVGPARAIFFSATSARTIVASQSGNRSSMNATCDRSEIPPIDERTCAEIAPCASGALHHHDSIARDFESKLRRRLVVEVDRVDGAAEGTFDLRQDGVVPSSRKRRPTSMSLVGVSVPFAADPNRMASSTSGWEARIAATVSAMATGTG
jgi:hypothetical protein